MELYLILTIGIIIFIGLIIRSLKKWKKLPAQKIAKIKQNWQKIERESDLKKAILEADKLLDYTLTCKGYQGSLGQKLKTNPQLFSSIDNIWWAHKVRNKIAHEIDFQLRKKQLQRVLKIFRKGLKDLRVFKD